MPQLIFLRSIGHLKDGRVVKEGELFEVDQAEADAFLRGGTIVRLVDAPVNPVKEDKYDAPVQTETPKTSETPEVIPEPHEPEKIYQKSQKKKR